MWLLSLSAFCASAQVAYDGDSMLRPENYREWIWVSSGFGMAYGPGAQQSEDPPFDNVFANPDAYRAFLKTGAWPDKTVLVLEVRSSQQRGSINQRGHFQGDEARVEVHVKDERRFPEKKWAFFMFGESARTSKPAAADSTCFSCHEKSGSVDTTFVQFYPILRDVAAKRESRPQGNAQAR
jgi:hypothetical protein